MNAKELEDRKWIEVQTPNFKIRSAISQKDTIELARYLESFRIAVALVTNVSRLDASNPTQIFVFRSYGDLKKFGLGDLAGAFIPGIRSNTIIVRDTLGMTETSTILHEYVHFLVRIHSGYLYPKWYHEGLAEYFAATKENQFGELEIGHTPEHRHYSFAVNRWVPMRDILSPTDYDQWSRERRSMFYAESWGLVHFLLNRKGRSTSFGQDMVQYVQLVETGHEAVDAFAQAFGITADELDTQVGRYLNDGGLPGFRIRIDKLLPDFDPAINRLSREETSLALAQLALGRGKYDQAERWYGIAAGDEDLRASAEAGLGDVQKFQDEFEAAQPYFENAIRLAPDDPYVQLDAAEYWHDRAEKTEDAEDRAASFERARKHYVSAWKLDQSIAETYAMFGRSYFDEGKDFAKAIEMLEEAEYRLPANTTIQIMLAEAYFAAGHSDEAKQRARSILSWIHSESELVKRLNKILSEPAGDSE